MTKFTFKCIALTVSFCLFMPNIPVLGDTYLAPTGIMEAGLQLSPTPKKYQFNSISSRICLMKEKDPLIRMGLNVIIAISTKALEEKEKKPELALLNNKDLIMRFLKNLDADEIIIEMFSEFIDFYEKYVESEKSIEFQSEYLKSILYSNRNIYLLPIWKTVHAVRKKYGEDKKYFDIIQDLSALVSGLLIEILNDKEDFIRYLKDPSFIEFLLSELQEIQDYLPLHIVIRLHQSIFNIAPSDSTIYFAYGLLLAELYSRYVTYDLKNGRRPMFEEALDVISSLGKSPLNKRNNKKVFDLLEQEIKTRQTLYKEIHDPKVRFDETRSVVRYINAEGNIVRIDPEGIRDITVKGKTSKEIYDMLLKGTKLPKTRYKKIKHKKLIKKKSKAKLFLIPLHKLSYLSIITLKTYLKRKLGLSVSVRLPKKLPKITVQGENVGTVSYKKLWINEIKKINPNIVCISLFGYKSKNDFIKYIEELKKMDVFIIIGGPLVTDSNEKNNIFNVLEGNEPDNFILVRGEGEDALLELVKIIGSSRPSEITNELIQAIKQMTSTGIWAKFKDRFIIKDYDKYNICYSYCLPEPRIAYKTGDDYYDYRIRLTGGCPHDCAFCGYICKKFRHTDINEVADWLEIITKGWKKDRPMKISIDDDNFLIWKGYVTKLKKALEERNLLGKIEFLSWGSIDSMLHYENEKITIDNEYIETIVKLGIKEIVFGTDGATNLNIGIHKNKEVHRGYQINHIIAITKILRDKGIDVYHNIIHGNPYSSLLELSKSLMVVGTSDIFSSGRKIYLTNRSQNNFDTWKFVGSPFIDVYWGSYFGNEAALFDAMGSPSNVIPSFYDRPVGHYSKYLKLLFHISTEVPFSEMLIFMSICRHYPFIWEELIEELSQDDDEELKALGRLAKMFFEYYVSKHQSGDDYLKSIEKTIKAITFFMEKKVSYKAIFEKAEKSKSLNKFLSQVKEDKTWSLESLSTYEDIIYNEIIKRSL